MNNDFMFSERKNDPYEDNAVFLTKVFTPGRFTALGALLVLSSVILILIGSAYLDIISLSNNISLPDTASNDFSKTICRSLFVLGIVGLVNALGAFISAFKSSRSGGRKFSALCPAVFLVGSVLTAGACIWYFIDRIMKGIKVIKLTKDSEIDYNFIFFNYCSFIPYVFLLIMSVCGIVFFISMIRTVKGKGLFMAGAGGYRLTAILTAITVLGLMVFYGLVLTSFQMTINDIAPVIVLFVPGLLIAAPLFYTAVLVKRCRIALESAQRTINMGGVNLYMSGDGESAHFYQSNYRSPDYFRNMEATAAPRPSGRSDEQGEADSRDPNLYSPPAQTQPSGVKDIPIVTDTTSQIRTDDPMLKEYNECPVCGEKNPPVCRFCNGCGKKLY